MFINDNDDRELIVFPDGRIKFPDGTIILPKGTSVISNKEEKEIKNNE